MIVHNGSMLSIEERVENGVKVLDDIMPDWVRHQYEDDLDIWSCYMCVLGFAFGSYQRGMYHIREKYEIHDVFLQEKCGFVPTNVGDTTPLEEEWKRVIKQRKGMK